MGLCCGSRKNKAAALAEKMKNMTPPLEGVNRKFVKKVNKYWLREGNKVKVTFDGETPRVKRIGEKEKREKGKKVDECDMMTDALRAKWFEPDADHVDEVKKLFKVEFANFKNGTIDQKKIKQHPEGRVALLIFCIHLTRLFYHGEKDQYMHDDIAIQLSKEIINDKWKQKFHKHWLPEKLFLILPLKFSENVEDSELYKDEIIELKRYADSSYEYEKFSNLFEKMKEESETQHKMLEKTGRFRDRNELLGRETTQEEREYDEWLAEENRIKKHQKENPQQEEE